MKYITKQISILLLLLSVFTACQQEIDDYFHKDTEEYVDTDVLSLLKQDPNYSAFVQLIEDVNGDSILNNGNVFTLFVPDNVALNKMDPSISKRDFFNYLITESYINTQQITQSTLLQSYGGKFIMFDVLGDTSFVFDGVNVKKGSPLTNNGRYYPLADIVTPRPNIYEYFTQTNPFFDAYYKNQDSVFLDLELSTPLYFNDEGQTVYDSVLSIINNFELEYFEISEEFRSRKATMLVFSQEQYDAALAEVYEQVGIDSIPLIWQNEVLMPYILDRSVFRNMLDYSVFLEGRVNNIKGDSVDVESDNINPDYFECSNGRVYNYNDFRVPEELYKVSDTVRLVERLYNRGNNLYDWGEEFEITGTKFLPEISNTKSLIVNMQERNYNGNFSMTYKHYNVFPGTYRLKFKVNTVSNLGVWSIFVNDEQLPVKKFNQFTFTPEDVLEYDLYEMVELQGFTSSLPVEENPYFTFYPIEAKTCIFETLVEDIKDFGDVSVRLEYVGPTSGLSSLNSGINIEFVALEYFEVE